MSLSFFFFFFQAEDGIRDVAVTGVQTCALPISTRQLRGYASSSGERRARGTRRSLAATERIPPSWFRVLPRGEPPEASRSARLVADFQHAPRLTLLVARHVARQRSGAQYAHGQRL